MHPRTTDQNWPEVGRGRMTMFLLRRKIDVVLANSRDITTLVQWFMQQIQVDHLILDVVSCEHVWVAIFGVSVAGVMAHLLMFDPFITMKNAPREYLAEMRTAEAAYFQGMMRKFVAEKLLVLAFVVIRSPDRNYFTTTRLPSLYKWTYHVTDATVFAVWFTLVWSVFFANDVGKPTIIRFVSTAKTVDKGETNEKQSKASDLERIGEGKSKKEDPNNEQLLMKRLILVSLACFLAATTLTSFGMTSFKAIHMLYALMFTVEGLKVLVRSVHVTYRVAWWHAVPNAALRNSEAFRRRANSARRSADVFFNGLSVAQYILYLIVGTIINGKLIPLVFVAQLTHHLQRLFSNLIDHCSKHETAPLIN
ncbi:hypothetical protein KIN20_016903 [Parelaphostrongylus tenuis]|uniref:Uncharacterized protein n=1 Tax=Parelaphostrongylus tenuis TaxID=148309 RepID=A0AAD5MMF7_PARTN|nr:hypothetical protein KIN20_016903 [Parelaphostrongylus tenuis]